MRSGRRWFPLVVLSLLAILAYFQASGIAKLTGSRFTGALDPGSGARSRADSEAAPGVRASPSSAEGSSGDPILRRNPFDSLTGPISREGVPKSVPSALPGNRDPLRAPSCVGLRVQLVTEAKDPRASVASLKAEGDTPARLLHAGDEINGHTVAYIGFNPRANSPAVWLSRDGELCQALLFELRPLGGSLPAVSGSGPVAPARAASAAGR
jgi:general secretion pathway protein C